MVMQANIEQPYAIKFCIELRKAASETLRIIKTADGDVPLSSAQIFRYYMAPKSLKMTGRLSTSKIDVSVTKVRFALA
ncbi:hypothetical protein Trydic_g13672 [Trypoxylus dichotomus]